MIFSLGCKWLVFYVILANYLSRVHGLSRSTGTIESFTKLRNNKNKKYGFLIKNKNRTFLHTLLCQRVPFKSLIAKSPIQYLLSTGSYLT